MSLLGTPAAPSLSANCTEWNLVDLLPHRYPFLLIDRVIEFEDSKRIVCIKNVTWNEPFFQGHFPGRPVMPGVLQIEGMAQAGCILARQSSGGVPANRLLFLVGVENARFKRPVVPGDALRIEMNFTKRKGPLWLLEGSIHVDGKLTASASISAAEGA